MGVTLSLKNDDEGGDDGYVIAYGLGLSTPRVRGYEGIDLKIAKGSVHALCGEHRSGKTELLLTLAGRMRANVGTMAVAGRPIASLGDVNRLRRRCGLGFFERLNELSGALRVSTATAAELSLAGRPCDRAHTERYLDEWGLADVAGRSIESLPRCTYDRLGIALGMCAAPDILAIHDIERDLTEHQSLSLLDRLRTIAADTGVTVICGVTDYDLAARFDGVTCISDDARAQRDACQRERGTSRAA